jgi:hypothetical protein
LLYVTLAAVVGVTIALSLVSSAPLRQLRSLAILACYVIGVLLLFADRWRAVAVWSAIGIGAGLLYSVYEARSLEASERGAVSSHALFGLVAWPVMLPEAIEYWLADAGLLGEAAAEEDPALASPNMATLEELGYFKYTPKLRLKPTEDAIEAAEFPFYDEGSGRFFWADAETLAEKGVASFLRELEPTLESVGVHLGTVEEAWGEDYWITVDGQRHLLWASDEADEARALAAVRTFTIVNDLLSATGTEERLYAVGGDNDLVAVLLTPELLELFSTGTNIHERPYVPKIDPPWYGMPHDEP